MSSRGTSQNRRNCVFGCVVPILVHICMVFHPERRPVQFQEWVSIVGNKLKESDPIKIYKNKKVCSYHFPLEQKLASHRLQHSAVPSLFLDGKHSSPGMDVQLEHNYCVPGVQTRDEVAMSQTAMNPPDTDATKQQLLLDHANQPSTSSESIQDKSSDHLIKRHRTALKEIRKLKSQQIKAKKKELLYKSRISALTEKLSDVNAFKIVTKHMNKAEKMFTDLQFRHAKKKPKGRRYTIDEKVMALSLYKRSPKGYSLFAKYFKLPSAKTLKNLLGEIQISPGINDIIFKKLNETVSGLREEDRLCTLIFDEISIEPQILYQSSSDEFKGFTSLNEEKIANHALVFMVKGIKANFKQPVAYYFTQSLKMVDLKSIIIDVIKNVLKTGLKILCIKGQVKYS